MRPSVCIDLNFDNDDDPLPKKKIFQLKKLIQKNSLEFNIDDYDGDGSSPYWFAHTRKSSHKLIRDLSLFQLTVPLGDEEKLFLK